MSMHASGRRISVRPTASIVLRAGLLAALCALPAAAQNQVWIHQLGSTFSDTGTLAPDGAGGIFVGGRAATALAGPSQGSLDAWVGRYDGSGGLLWAQQFGTPVEDELLALASDGAGGVFLGGYTAGALGTGSWHGSHDAWLQRRDAGGTVQWSVQFGTFEEDVLLTLAADGAGGVLVGGSTLGSLGGPFAGGAYSDAWIARFDSLGNQSWITQFGTSWTEEVHAITDDGAGGAFAAGITRGNLAVPPAGVGDFDGWLAHVDAAGAVLWIQQLGTPGDDDVSGAIADGSGGVLLCGGTTRDLFGPSQGGRDTWLARFDGAGNVLWGRQYGTSAHDAAADVTVDGQGGGYVTGVTTGAFGASHAGLEDIWIERIDLSGNGQWVHQFGSSASDWPTAVAADGPGTVFVGGQTLSNLGGSWFGSADAVFARFDDPCGHSTYCVASSTSLPGCQASIGATGTASLANPAGFSIQSGSIPGGLLGVAIFSASGAASLPMGSLGGKICFNPPIFRSAAKLGGGTPGQCNGLLTVTLQDLVAASPVIVPGAQIRAEFWARDPANPDGFLLSDGLQFLACP